MQQQKRLMIFMVVALGIMLAGTMIQHYVFKGDTPNPTETTKPIPKELAEGVEKLVARFGVPPDGSVLNQLALEALLADWNKPPQAPSKPATAEKPPEPKPAPKPHVPSEPIKLGPDGPSFGAHYNLFVELDPDTAGVTRLVLNKFQQADKNGKPEDEDGKKKPLQLFPQEDLADKASLRLPNDDTAPSTFYRLQYIETTETGPNKKVEKVVEPESWKVVEQASDENSAHVEFMTETPDFFIFKKYTLNPGDYHIELEVTVKLKEGHAKKDFQYQLTSPYNLRVEGEWYTTTFRNAVMCKTIGDGYPLRTLSEGRLIGHAAGTDPDLQTKWAGGPGDDIHFFGVAVQFFASVIAVDYQQKNDIQPKTLLERATPVIEKGQIKAVIKSIDDNLDEFRLTYKESHWFSKDAERDIDHPFYVAKDNVEVRARLAQFKKNLDQKKANDPITVRYRKSGDKYWATSILNDNEARGLFIDDISVRAVSKPIKWEETTEVTHKYKLYNGPVKVRLLKQLEGDKEVDPKLVNDYMDKEYLAKLTDAPSTSWPSEHIFGPIGLTWLLVQSTNLMHGILYYLHYGLEKVLPYQWTWGLCILFLTIMVRASMFPVSRKQSMTSIRMQQLGPELNKLKEKYKNDRQGMGAAQMELYRKHGINPFGSCWLILLQMPIFLGLYYALQESIHFRLAPFIWIDNLAAPDMLLPWYDKIPWISTPESYGGWIYLGPYFNLLPVIAVAFMIVQQSMLTPPPADEQQAMQMKMMKYMMIFFGLMFYKVAAGLCIYFIASSIWGFTERKLLPKRKLVPGAPPLPPAKPTLFSKLMERVIPSNGPKQGTAASTYTTSPPPAPESRGQSRRKQRRARNKQGRGDSRDASTAGTDNGAMKKVRSWWTNLREWWAEILKQAQKK